MDTVFPLFLLAYFGFFVFQFPLQSVLAKMMFPEEVTERPFWAIRAGMTSSLLYPAALFLTLTLLWPHHTELPEDMTAYREGGPYLRPLLIVLAPVCLLAAFNFLGALYYIVEESPESSGIGNLWADPWLHEMRRRVGAWALFSVVPVLVTEAFAAYVRFPMR